MAEAFAAVAFAAVTFAAVALVVVALVVVALDAAAGLIGAGENGADDSNQQSCLSDDALAPKGSGRATIKGNKGRNAQPGALNRFDQLRQRTQAFGRDRSSDTGLEQAGRAKPWYGYGWQIWNGTSGQKPRQRCQGWSQIGCTGSTPGMPQIFPLDGTLPGSDYSPSDCSTSTS